MKNEKLLFLLFLLLAFIFRVQIAFLDYLSFIDKPVKEISAKVVNQYKKRNYYVLKLHNNSLTFYTISRDNLKNLINENISLKIFTKNISFFDYLTNFFAISFDLRLEKANPIDIWIEKQHKSKKITNLYKALFLGEAIDYKTRQELSSLGISHLFALSGFHLGFISFLLYFSFGIIYKKFHKFFPYRNRYADLGILVLMVEFIYLYITSFPPSLIRAYVMEVILFLFALRLQNIFDLRVLIFTIVVSFLIFFTKIISIGFLLSILGVFYIVLFFKYFKANLLNTILMNFFLFLMMFVISHSFFGNFNYYQLLSPIITLLFTIFYPISFLFHLLGIGGVFDGIIFKYLSLGGSFFNVKFPLWFLGVFLALSFLAYYKKWAFYGINLLAIIMLGGVFV